MNHKTAVRAVLLLSLATPVAIRLARAEIIEQILVKVNGEIFTKTDLEQRQVLMLRQKGQQIDLKSDPYNVQLRKVLDDITPQIMVDAIDEMLMVQRGRELGYKLGDDQFKNVLDNIRKENKLETEEQLQAALKAENMTMTELRKNLEKSMIVQRVQQNEVMGKIGVTEDEAKKYYDTHLNEFTTQPTVTLREILVAVPADGRGLSVAADEAAKARAEAIRARAIGGEAFDKLAADVSDAPSKANAGLIGPLSLTDVSSDLRARIDKMKAGEISEAMRSNRGYQLLKLETKTPTQVMTLDQAREQIGERVFTNKRKVEFLKYLDKLRGQAIIEWKNPDVKKAFEQGLKQQAAPTL
ncbi:MAG: peptidyl-prolyl cis-trans isomerase [Acidobacteria bacterium]|nr:peptidyl-prolyl cis-trans isomerase [Acidobacteriota bacterium]